MSEKILIICSVHDVTPYVLLEGTDGIGSRSNPAEYILVTKDSEYGRVLMCIANDLLRKCGWRGALNAYKGTGKEFIL